MRLIHPLLLSAILLPGAALADGGFCFIPDLVQGRPTEVPVEDINKGLCGAARIDRQIVRLEEVVWKKLDGPIVCDPAGQECWRRVEYYLRESDSFPYVVIFKGPKAPAQG